MIRECFVGRDADHAARISRGPLLYKYEAYAAWGHNDREGSFAERFDDFCGERFLVGDGSRVRELVERHLASPAVDRLMLRVWWPGLEQDETLAVIRRIGRIIGGLPG